ncbi:DUF1775 domain-containing protein [Streptomyces sp. NPDC020681]|uniref:DUF1775 domain-containing protein n=1 Tax=Streptomyces sp. NPDC020681 TaxID=3365083 RepID=UPI003798CAFE
MRRLSALAVATAALATVLAVAGPAAAHAHVTASDARALAKNVTLTFSSEAESETAGIAKLQVVLPEGIAPDAVSLKEAPAGWKFTPTQDGYTVAGKALATGKDVEYSVTVKQLPDAKSLVFKTIDTYGDGKVSRWIEVPDGGTEPENPAPVLALKPAAPGATLEPTASPTPTPTPTPATPTPAPSQSSTPPQAAEKDDDGGNGALIGIIAAVVVVAAAAAGVFWFKRRQGPTAS